MTLLPLQKPASETTPAEEIKAAPREFALFVQGENSPEVRPMVGRSKAPSHLCRSQDACPDASGRCAWIQLPDSST